MKACRKAALAAVALAASSLWAADPGVTFIGRGQIAGNALDSSGLTGNICSIDIPANCIDKKTLGGFGSAITYTGHNGVFLATPDRGPFDGRTNIPYLDRFYFLRIKLDTTVNPSSGAFNISTTLLDTRFLKNEANQNLVGDSSAFNVVNRLATRRFDPEGVVATFYHTFLVSDEYGPYINEFTAQGRLIRRLHVPSKFLISNPTGQLDSAGNSFELYPTTALPPPPGGGNDTGRQANRGMEGLAITPNGRYLVGIMQNALIQDNGLDGNTPPGRKGLNNRILRYDLLTGRTKEFVYTMDKISQGKGVSEILAINNHEFLVLERDNRSLVTPGADAFSTSGSNCCGLKRIYKIDLDGATDVSDVDSLPDTAAGLAGLVPPVVPVSKVLFLDLLDPSYKVDATNTIKQVIAEKMEGMAWGPDLPDGRHVLYLVSDNDLNTTFPTQIYAFAIDEAAANIDFQRQFLPIPLYFPWE